MAERQPISTAPRNGASVTVYWTDGDGVENESQGRYVDGGGEAGWWVFTDSDTQRRVRPHSWRPGGSEGDA